MAAKVDSVLFYGSMFLFLAPGVVEQLDLLQVELDRSLLGAPPWLAASLVRAAAGWQWTWSERLLYEVLVFRAELWCCKNDMLVRQGWAAAQVLPGRTFANASRSALTELGFQEVFQFEGWPAFLDSGAPVLPSYKAALKGWLVTRSVSKWRNALVLSGTVNPIILALQFPCSVGCRLLEAGFMCVLHHADRWDSLRLGIGAAARLSELSGRHRVCRLCASVEYGLAHLLSACPTVAAAREHFLQQVGVFYASKLVGAPAGDWPTLVFSPHADLVFLQHAVVFGATILDNLKIRTDGYAR